MFSISLTRHFCRRTLKWADLSQEPAASNLPSAQGELRDTPEEGSAPRMETDLEELQGSASCWTIQRAMRSLRDILSDEELDNPLCEGCTNSLLGQLDTQLRISGSDSQTYKRCLETRDGLGEDSGETRRQELKVREEARLVQELEEVEKNRDRAAMALEAPQAETEMLEQQERQSHRDLSELQWQQLELQDELWSLEDRLLYAQTQLAWLKRTNAFKALFEICCDGPIAIINSFRLGCTLTVPVSWREINAAWGHTALLLVALPNTVGLQFQRYQLIPHRDHCYLKSLTEDPMELPLFCTGGKSSPLDSKFDQAMVAFLDCMQQFNEEANKGKSALCMPCGILVEQGLIKGEMGQSPFHQNPLEHGGAVDRGTQAHAYKF